MIDMLFFLLVFFVLTSNFTSTRQALTSTSPRRRAPRRCLKQPLLIGVTRDGSIHVNESPVSIKALLAVLQHYMSEDPDRMVVVVADRDALISKAVDVLDACNWLT